jgi:hypothetical protein
MGARSLERMNQPRGIIELQAGFSSHQCAKHPIVWFRVPPNTDVSKRLASWKSLSFNRDTSNEPLVLASKAKNLPMLLYGITTSPRPRKALESPRRFGAWTGAEVSLVALCCFLSRGGSLVGSGRWHVLGRVPSWHEADIRGLGPISILDDRADPARTITSGVDH